MDDACGNSAKNKKKKNPNKKQGKSSNKMTINYLKTCSENTKQTLLHSTSDWELFNSDGHWSSVSCLHSGAIDHFLFHQHKRMGGLLSQTKQRAATRVWFALLYLTLLALIVFDSSVSECWGLCALGEKEWLGFNLRTDSGSPALAKVDNGDVNIHTVSTNGHCLSIYLYI